MLAFEPVIDQMQSHIRLWEQAADDRALFLRCYLLMTGNMLAAIDRRDFDDPQWIDRLLHHIARSYFLALDAYQRDPASAPAVWRQAHAASAAPHVTPVQKLLLGVNAHVNYDLVLALVDLLQPEWSVLSEPQRASRYADHCRVNHIIGHTLDAMQDQVVEPAMPLMGLVDRLMGPMDELLMSRLVARWRQRAWVHAARLLAARDPQEQARLWAQVEADALRTGKLISPGR